MIESILPVVFIIITVIIMAVGISFGIRENKSIIERAKKIDPSVKTVSEAQYVLKKDIAQSMNKKDK